MLKWPAIDASFGAIDALSGAGFTAIRMKPRVGSLCFSLGVAVIQTTPAAQAASVSERNE